MQAHGGQRTWTAMAYLNNVEEGGATWFPAPASASSPKSAAAVDLEQYGP
jgi:prolyl 4-hydroxylase